MNHSVGIANRIAHRRLALGVNEPTSMIAIPIPMAAFVRSTSNSLWRCRVRDVSSRPAW
jgi:hypothetical protein